MVVVVATTLIGGAIMFYYRANTIDVPKQHKYVMVSFLPLFIISQLPFLVVAVVVMVVLFSYT